ncbi:VanZ family protein [Ruminococcus albus]|uniref:VanZ like family protein n=1 Tax=Ruminococcus albus TaxID=1264 RepID=A0A1I1GCT5_RUMAL|nr:VanZ family protein [Ruminococcus albus]SFC09256.1 VanZ like family protein [Ruminococcus albus]
MDSKLFNFFRWVILIAMCIVIFVFSSSPANDSTNQSRTIVMKVIHFFYIDFDKKPVPEQAAIYSLLTILVRKGAHFSEYALLAALAFSAFYGIHNRILRLLSSVAAAALYACTDEFHQTFVPGRAGMMRDVIIDSSGALFGAIVACCIAAYFTAWTIIRKNSYY